MRQLGGICDATQPDLIVGIESRGFIVGAPLAHQRRIGFVPVRKPGKLPGRVLGVDYELEYGRDRLEIQSDAFEGSPRILVVDDLLATGGTAVAGINLIRALGGNVSGCGFIIDLPEIGGAKKLKSMGVEVKSLVVFEGH